MTICFPRDIGKSISEVNLGEALIFKAFLFMVKYGSGSMIRDGVLKKGLEDMQ